MNCTLSKKCAVNTVRCIAWNCPDHVSWIWQITKLRNLAIVVSDMCRSKWKRMQLTKLTYIFKNDGHLILLCKMILLQQDTCLLKGRASWTGWLFWMIDWIVLLTHRLAVNKYKTTDNATMTIYREVSFWNWPFSFIFISHFQVISLSGTQRYLVSAEEKNNVD
jgi:hypothetical protein